MKPALTIVIPSINGYCHDYIREVSKRLGRTSVLIMPAVPESYDFATLKDLMKVTESIQTFSTTPNAISEKHQNMALRAAVQYELGRIAIPMHCQNLCDRLKRKYGFSGLRDVQVARILERSELVNEVGRDVYRSTVRFRNKSPETLIRSWAKFLEEGGFRNVYSLSSYAEALDEWFINASADDGLEVEIPNAPVAGWLEHHHKGKSTLYRLYPGKEASARLHAAGASMFLHGVGLADVFRSETEPLDSTVVRQAEALHRVREQLAARPRGVEAERLLFEYASLWLALITNQHVRGQSQKWRGWYLVPEHGSLVVAKLLELQRIIRAIKRMAKRGSLLVDQSPEGIANAVALLKAGQVVYSKDHSDAKKRNLFIRQQKNYLIRLGLVTEPAAHHLGITEQGLSWAILNSERALIRDFRQVLKDIRWTWCDMPFFAFLCELADRCKGEIAYRELSNWIIHAYDWKQLDELVNALEAYRSLSDASRDRLNTRIEKRLVNLLCRHSSEHAFGHYRTKNYDLMKAFSSTGMFRLVKAKEMKLIRTQQRL